MILKASQRSSAMQLGAHLLNANDNEHVEVHEVSGFIADDLIGAMKEAEATAMGTKCKQHLFSVSLSPPQNEVVAASVFEDAIDRIEKAHGLSGHPRMVVFHEKEGRRHAHCVWSRINGETMTAVNLSHFKLKLRAISKEIYLEQGWVMPRGLVDSVERDPRNFTLAEWQQSKRTQRDPRELRTTISECYAASDSMKAFAHALQSRGLYLAKGDRRGFVALTLDGEVVSVARQVGKPAREIGKRLGDPSQLESVDATRARIASEVAPKLRGLLAEAAAIRERDGKALNERRRAMTAAHAKERKLLDTGITMRHAAETKLRASRLRGGLQGLWDRMTGEHGRARAINEREALTAMKRDRAQRDYLIGAQLAERRVLQTDIRQMRHKSTTLALGLHRSLAGHAPFEGEARSDLQRSFRQAARGESNRRATPREPQNAPPTRNRGLSFDL